MAVVDGADLRVYIDGTVIAFATSSTINLNAEFDQLAPTAAGDASFNVIKPRRQNGTINTNALYGTSSNKDFKDLFTAYSTQASVSIAFKYDSAGEWKYSRHRLCNEPERNRSG